MSRRTPSTAFRRRARRATVCTLAAAFAVIVATPATAVAQCPGCDEYTFDLPDDSGDQAVPAEPVPVAPTAPTYVPPVTSATPIVVAPEPEPDPEKPERLVESRSEEGIAPIALSPIDPASAVSAGEASMLPLIAVIALATGIGIAVGLRKRASAD